MNEFQVDVVPGERQYIYSKAVRNAGYCIVNC